jgi:hypothetical protein
MHKVSSLIMAMVMSMWTVPQLSAGTIDPATGHFQVQATETEPLKHQITQGLPSSLEAASKALETLKFPNYFKNDPQGLEHAKNLGFQSIDEVTDARLGKPFEVKDVGLKQLQDFGPKDDPGALLNESHETIYPIYVKDAVRSSLTVSDARKKGDWRWIAMGSANLVRKTEQTRQLHSSTETFLVRIRGIGIRFLAVSNSDGLTLIALSPFEFGNISFKEGQELSAQATFTMLAPVAKKLLARADFLEEPSRRQTK